MTSIASGDLGLMSAAEVAALLEVTPGTLRNWRSAGRGPRYVTGLGVIKYRAEDIKAYITANVIDPAKKSSAPTLSNPHPRRQQRMTATEAADAP